MWNEEARKYDRGAKKSSNKKEQRNEQTLRKIPKLTTQALKKNPEEPIEVLTRKDNETNPLSATTSAAPVNPSRHPRPLPL